MNAARPKTSQAVCAESENRTVLRPSTVRSRFRDKYLALYDAMAMEWPIAAESRVVATGWGETFVRVSGPAGASR